MSNDSEKIAGMAIMSMARDIDEKNDEIERLRGAYEQERRDCINLTEKVIPNLRAEIERSRKERDDILAAKEIVFVPQPIPEGFVIQELQKANAALHADIARLRSGVRCPHCDELRLDLGDARGEIERLREQLARCKRVCEAAELELRICRSELPPA